MTEFQPQFDLGRLVSALDDDLQTQLDFLSISPAAYTTVQQYLAADLQSVRFNILSDMLAISDLWKPIRDRAAVADVLLELTSSLHIHAQAQHIDGWKQLEQLVADGLGCFNHDKVSNENCALENDDERDRYVQPDTIADFIESNAWIVTLYLLRRTPTVRKLLREVSERARRVPASSSDDK